MVLYNDNTCPLDKFLTSKCGNYPHVVKVFIRFLHIHGAYGKYAFNYAHASDSWKSENQVEGGDPYQLFSRAFSWELSPQGYCYWKNLNDLWRSRLTLDLHIY